MFFSFSLFTFVGLSGPWLHDWCVTTLRILLRFVGLGLCGNAAFLNFEDTPKTGEGQLAAFQSFWQPETGPPQEVVKQGPAIKDRKFGKLFKFAQSAAFFSRFSLGSGYHSGDLGAPWALAASTTAGGTTWRTSFAPTGGPQPTC